MLKYHFLEQLRHFGLQEPLLQGKAHALQHHPRQLTVNSLPDACRGQICSQGRVYPLRPAKSSFLL